MSNTMIRLIIAALFLGLSLCTEFPSRYERIEPNALRAIGFSYLPYAEGSPGDTMTVRAYFGGEKVVSVGWTYSTDHAIDGYGTDTVLNIREVPIIDASSNLPDSIDISFVLPDSIFFTTKGLSSRVYDAVRSALPPGMRSLSQQEHAAFLSDLMAINPSDPAMVLPFIGTWGEKMGIATLDSSAFETVLTVGGMLLRAFSVPGVLYATATSETGKKLKIRGDFTIRYNRKLAGTDFEFLLPVNHNPLVRWIGVYTVRKKGSSSFNPHDTTFSGKYAFNYLYNAIFPDSVNDTIVIDTGCTYFFAADSGIVSYTLKAGTRVIDSISGKDTTWRTIDSDLTVTDTAIDRFTVQTIVNGVPKDTTETETWSYDWQYQNLDLDSVTEPLDSLFMVGGRGGSWIVPSLPSLDPNMTHARIWVTVRDAYIDFNRPVGITIHTADIYFKYSEAYRNRRN